MKLVVCSVRDSATESFDRPMFFVSVGQAIRTFSDEVNRKAEQNMMNMHPDDYDMYELGSYETETGESETHKPDRISIGKQVKIPE